MKTSKKQQNLNKINQVFAEINQQLSLHFGGVELVEWSESGQVKVKLTGHCKGCPFSAITLKNGIEKALISQLPDLVKEVIEVK